MAIYYRIALFLSSFTARQYKKGRLSAGAMRFAEAIASPIVRPPEEPAKNL